VNGRFSIQEDKYDISTKENSDGTIDIKINDK